MTDLNYVYRIVFVVEIVGDGQHADGDGATATQRRLRKTIEKDPRVQSVMTDPPKYMNIVRS